MEQTLTRLKELITRREAIDAELQQILGGQAPTPKRTLTCSRCNQPGHTARSCSKEQPAES